jgi:hypothetical protein
MKNYLDFTNWSDEDIDEYNNNEKIIQELINQKNRAKKTIYCSTKLINLTVNRQNKLLRKYNKTKCIKDKDLNINISNLLTEIDSLEYAEGIN